MKFNSILFLLLLSTQVYASNPFTVFTGIPKRVIEDTFKILTTYKATVASFKTTNSVLSKFNKHSDLSEALDQRRINSLKEWNKHLSAALSQHSSEADVKNIINAFLISGSPKTPAIPESNSTKHTALTKTVIEICHVYAFEIEKASVLHEILHDFKKLHKSIKTSKLAISAFIKDIGKLAGTGPYAGAFISAWTTSEKYNRKAGAVLAQLSSYIRTIERNLNQHQDTLKSNASSAYSELKPHFSTLKAKAPAEYKKAAKARTLLKDGLDYYFFD